jgi:hypothetical protein
LIELLVCDRIKSQLSEGALRYILGVENQSKDGWLHLNELVESLDIFYATHSVFDRPKYTQTAVSGGKQKPSRPSPPDKTHQDGSVSVKASSISNKTGTEKSSVKRCYVCGSDQHLSRYHDNKSGKSEGKPARVNSCAIGRNEGAESPPDVTNAAALSAEVPVTSPTSSQSGTNTACREVVVETLVSCDVNAVVSSVSSTVGQCPNSSAPLDYRL